MTVVIVEGEGAVFEVNLGHSIVTNGDGDALFSNYFGEDLLTIVCSWMSLLCSNEKKFINSTF